MQALFAKFASDQTLKKKGGGEGRSMLSWRFTVEQQCLLALPSNCSLQGLYLFLCGMASVSLAAELGSGNTSILLKIAFTVHLSLFSFDWNCPHLNLLGWAILLTVCICLVTTLLFQQLSPTPRHSHDSCMAELCCASTTPHGHWPMIWLTGQHKPINLTTKTDSI